MRHSRRSFAWPLILALLCVSFAVVAGTPVAQAATTTLYVNTATDPYPAPNGSCGFLADPINDICSLRTAIIKANSVAAGDTVVVKFQIRQNYPGYLNEYPYGPSFQVQTWTIQLNQPLDFITHDNMEIDGFSQAQYIGNNPNPFGPEIIVDGSLQTQSGGLTFQSSNNIVKGLGIINFKTSGGLTGVGIEFRSSGNNFGTGNIVQGCFIGVDRLGASPAPNTIGIWVRTNNNHIGEDSTTTDQYNIISGNLTDGVLIEGEGNTVQGNLIGLNSTGLYAVGNQGNGVSIRIASNNLIGSPTDAVDSRYRNIISGNYQHGVQIYNGQGNQIYGNVIGLDVTGAAAVPNQNDGVMISSSGGQTKDNIVGSTNFFNRNTISGNGNAGIHIMGDNTSSNQVFNNYIGTNTGGLLAPTGAYTQTGVLIDQGADANQIGGSATNQANVISSNKSDGVRVLGLVAPSTPVTIVQSNDNKIIGNLIGYNYLGLSPLPNDGNGIYLDTYVLRTIIGGSSVADRNIIAYNKMNGIYLGATAVLTTTILKNTIERNTQNGILANGALYTRIDGGDATNPNNIHDNGMNGIALTNALTTTVQYNHLEKNAQNGIRVNGALNYNTIVNANSIVKNSQHGVQVDAQAWKVQITSNTIYTNTLSGVLVQDSGLWGTQFVKITDNSMQGNGVKGIELSPTTIWPASGTLTNPNHDIDPPYNLHIDQAGNLSGRVRLKPDGPAVEACAQPCTIQVFATNPQTLDGQGRDKINVSPNVVANVQDPTFGTFSLSIGALPEQLALTATDKDGNTSEFAVFTRVFGLTIQPPLTRNPVYPGDIITYTHHVTNTGTVDFTNIQLTANSKLGWPFELAPANPISLAAGEGTLVTVTLKLPTGSDSRVRYPNTELTRVTVSALSSLVSPPVNTTASVTDTSVLGARFQMTVSDAGGKNGNGPPEAVVDYPHIVTNTGNVSGTVILNAATDLGWDTVIEPSTLTLQPGDTVGVRASVTIPKETVAGTVGHTILTLDGSRYGMPAVDVQQLVVTDTTTVLLTPLATMIPPRSTDGGAGETVQFCHTVTNGSNGVATFAITGVSSLGSKITFISDTPGQQLVNGTTFTVNNTPGNNIFSFCANVVVDIRALRGQTDLISIGLIDINGDIVGGASVHDEIRVVRSAVAPRLMLPIATR